MEDKEIILMQNEDGTWSEKPEPFAVIECPTEEDFKDFEKALQIRRNLPGVISEIEKLSVESNGFQMIHTEEVLDLLRGLL